MKILIIVLNQRVNNEVKTNGKKKQIVEETNGQNEEKASKENIKLHVEVMHGEQDKLKGIF